MTNVRSSADDPCEHVVNVIMCKSGNAYDFTVAFIPVFPFLDLHESDDSAGSYNPNDGSEPTTVAEMKKWVLGTVPFDMPETLRRELKEFRLLRNGDSPIFQEHELRFMFERNDFGRFGPAGLARLFEMIEYYLPKYFTSFMNTSVDMSEFMIGLTDDGEVTGVILPTSVTGDHIYWLVWSRIESIIRSQNLLAEQIEHYVEQIRSRVEVNMVELGLGLDLLDDWTDDYLDLHRSRIRKYNEERHTYLTKMREIARQMEFYRRAVDVMLNDSDVHPEFIEFIRTHEPVDEQVRSLIGPTTRQDMISALSTPITYARGQISDEKGDPRNMAYWITKFRDERVEQIRLSRPRCGASAKPVPLYTSLMNRNPIHRIASSIRDDPRLKIVVVQIILPGKSCIPHPPGQNFHRFFSYIDSNGATRVSVRHMTGNGPSCI